MPVQSCETTNILLLLQGQHQCVLVALAKTVSQFTHNCTHIHPAPAHRVSYLHSLVLPCEAGTNFTYNTICTYSLYILSVHTICTYSLPLPCSRVMEWSLKCAWYRERVGGDLPQGWGKPGCTCPCPAEVPQGACGSPRS